MPHLIIEYSKNAVNEGNIRQLMSELAATASNTGIIKAEDIKIRASAYEQFLVAGIPDGFVHLSVYLLSGRTSGQKVSLSTALREAMMRFCSDVTSLSVDVRDMDPVAYKKRLKSAVES